MLLKDRLAELRRARGLTLREVRDLIEERTGEKLSVSYLSALERNETAASVEMLNRIAGGYSISLRDLLEPVDMYTSLFDPPTDERYPPALREANVPEEWKQTLFKIQFRGRRPETAAQWEAIYAMLRTYIDE
jgi:transcriptional regulator with XRE-family HTH domain